MAETNLRIPPLRIHITCLNKLTPESQTYANICRLRALPPQMQLPEGCMLLSAVHPTAGTCMRSFLQNDGVWYLPGQDVALSRSSTHPLAVLKPGLRLQVLCPNQAPESQTPGQNPAPAAPTSEDAGYCHMLSLSAPLLECMRGMMQNPNNVFSMRRETVEDGMTYQMDVSLDMRSLSLAGLQRTASEMQRSIEELHVHNSALAKSLGMPALMTVEELVAQAEAFRQNRQLACQQVLQALCLGNGSCFNLNLMYGRALGMTVDQEACCALRQGSVLSHGFEQTLLHATLAMASLMPKIAQERGLDISLVEHEIGKYAPAQLWQDFLKQGQLAYCCRTQYHFDASFGPTFKVMRAVENADGSTSIRVIPSFGMVTGGAGEDQN